MLQVGLIILIILVMPRAPPNIFGGSQAESISEEAEGKATRIAAKEGTEFFSVVFDAGSTGQCPAGCNTSSPTAPAE